MKLRSWFAFVCCLLCLGVSAQSASDYLSKAKARLNEGNCESAQRFYNVYKNLSGKTDSSVEALIIDCNNKNTVNTIVRDNYTETAYGLDMKMAWVEGGDFLMGCTFEQKSCRDDEKTVRRVNLDGFYIGVLEVTQSQWEKVMGTSINQQSYKAGSDYMYGVGANYPMYYVSWDDAMEFCRVLSKKTGKTYTLPTEAQWEYAARGGNGAEITRYSGSNAVELVAWYVLNSDDTSHECGTKSPNALGLYDMSGNIREWCNDRYDSSYSSYDTNNPLGSSVGAYRVARGGSWDGHSTYCRVSSRGHYAPSLRSSSVGFRVVCIP